MSDIRHQFNERAAVPTEDMRDLETEHMAHRQRHHDAHLLERKALSASRGEGASEHRGAHRALKARERARLEDDRLGASRGSRRAQAHRVLPRNRRGLSVLRSRRLLEGDVQNRVLLSRTLFRIHLASSSSSISE